MKKEGIVFRSTGSWYDVKTEDGESIQCRIVGKFRLGNLKITNPVAVGDVVIVTIEEGDDEGIGSIIEIKNRTNYVIRQSPRKKHQLHLLASNVDQSICVMTIAQPKLKQGFIDRYLLMTEPYNIPTRVIFNKADIYSEGDLNVYLYLKDIYEKIGHPCHLVSAITGEGIAELRAALQDKTTLIGGQSGVGKSTLINAIEPHLALRTDDISEYTGKGQHTTTFAEMFELTGGGRIIDTPGIKTLAFSHFEPLDVAHNFKEIFKFSENCKFSNCMHRDEPSCAVKAAVEDGEISELRYMNYLQILEEIEDQNYWERHSDM
ncbi:ribosome small subunit-dependent GTPase A [Portibacter lacus]|uniref:Small ribosomal subunit biogenesis GTPase RsgA n=1 Tax=Portibacter lacus TaxID=1099794 RepID=A0AA37SQN6_9BACT|nr:ribosome small subunit-dependent GTPase A [Portibacter lacus]GLR17724.1 putative ribosome biogenesis GTPase RsgA [Portibacter lacus]